MAYNIYDLMDSVRDDTVSLPEDGTADLRRIKELTMKKIENQQGVRPAVKKTGRVARGLLIAAIVAVMCTATVAAARLGVADSFKGYFGDLTAEEKQLMEEMGTTDMPAPVTSNGTTITPLAVYGDAYNYYIRLMVQAPEGTVLRIPDEGSLMPRGTEGGNILETAGYDFSGMGYSVKWEDSIPGDNTLEGVVYMGSQMLSDDAAQRVGETRMRFDDGQPKWLHITGLPDLSAQAAPVEVDTSGLTVESTQPGRMIYLDAFRISSTYIQVKYDSDSIDDFDAPPCEPEGGWALVLDDGTEVAGDDSDVGGGSYNNSHVDLYYRFAAPIDVTQVDYIRFGDQIIPVR